MKNYTMGELLVDIMMDEQRNKENNTTFSKEIFLLLILGGILIFYMNTFFCYDKFNSDGHKVFGASYMTMNNEFYKVLNNEIEKEIQTRGDRLITLDPALSQDKQLEQIQYLVDQRVDAIFLNPVNWLNIKPGLELAKQAGIPVIIVDSEVYDDEMVSATIVSDNYHAGVLCARSVMEDLPEGGDILLLTHEEAKSALDRIEGFEEEIAKNKAFHIIDKIDTQGQTERSYSKVNDALKNNTNIDIIMALNDPAALGALAAIDQNKLSKKVYVYSVDGSPDGKRFIEEGKLKGTVAQYPKLMAKMTVDTAYQLLQGKPVIKENILQVEMVNSQNINSYVTERWQ